MGFVQEARTEHPFFRLKIIHRIEKDAVELHRIPVPITVTFFDKNPLIQTPFFQGKRAQTSWTAPPIVQSTTLSWSRGAY